VSDDRARRIQQQFGDSAAAYVTSAGHAGGDDLEHLLAWGRALAPRTVLDIATGGGHTALAFATIAPNVVGFDLTEPMLQAARAFVRDRGATIDFVGGDVEALPFRGGCFDVVTCRIAPHHFADVPASVREVARVLRPRGAFLVQDILGHEDPEANAFVTEVERRRDPSHVRAYRADEWRTFLARAGFAIVEQAVVRKVRQWDDWTGRTRMSPAARADLARFVREAPERCRKAFDFVLEGERVVSFTDRMILLEAVRP
jgi:ubiquinone/menaquinone biosynthesis C-methylase UbiE